MCANFQKLFAYGVAIVGRKKGLSEQKRESMRRTAWGNKSILPLNTNFQLSLEMHGEGGEKGKIFSSLIRQENCENWNSRRIINLSHNNHKEKFVRGLRINEFFFHVCFIRNFPYSRFTHAVQILRRTVVDDDVEFSHKTTWNVCVEKFSTVYLRSWTMLSIAWCVWRRENVFAGYPRNFY